MIAIRIENLGKYFGIPVNIGDSSSTEILHTFLRILGFNPKPAAVDDIQRTAVIAGHVLKDISIDIEEGSVVCLVGASGSGKSVLLKILANVIPPTTGRIEFNGAVTSLLGIGSNLDSRLTAEENIKNHSRFLRIPAENIDSYGRDVIAFAELQEFENVQVRTYSTGMTMRLSIALAMHGNPSILIVDDVLGVGDIAFRQKCVERLLELKDAGCTMVLASSDDDLVPRLASRILTLSGGRIIADGQPKQLFIGQNAVGTADIKWQVASHLPENDIISFQSISINDYRKSNDTYLSLLLECELKRGPLKCRPLIDVMQGKVVLFRSLYPRNIDSDGARRLFFTVEGIPTHILIDGTYKITIGIVVFFGKNIYSLKAFDAVTLTVRRDMESVDDTISIPLIAKSLPWGIESIKCSDV